MTGVRVRFKRKWVLLCAALLICSSVFYFLTKSAGNSLSYIDLVKPSRVVKELRSTDSDEYLHVLILSGVSNIERRQVIRDTWLSLKPRTVLHHFVIGTASVSPTSFSVLREEQSQHHDLLFLSETRDSFKNLTDKLLHALVWLASHHSPRFVLKCDDDSFVRLDSLTETLQSQKSLDKLYMGFFYGAGRVKTKGKYREENWVLCDHYLPYAFGGGYVLSFDLVQYIALNHHLFQLYNSEDLSLGTWLAPLKVNRVHDPRFDTEYKSRGCFNSYIVTHKQTPSMMREKHTNLQNSGQLCSEEVRWRYSYAYNWSVLPSECCRRYDPSIP
nr:EOG090X0A8N [Triops cancriformis]